MPLARNCFIALVITTSEQLNSNGLQTVRGQLQDNLLFTPRKPTPRSFTATQEEDGSGFTAQNSGLGHRMSESLSPQKQKESCLA